VLHSFWHSAHPVSHQQQPPHRRLWGRKRASCMGEGRRNVGSLGRYRRCGIASGHPMFSAVARHIKRLPSGVLSPLVIDQIQGVRVELNACFMLRLAAQNYIRDSFISSFLDEITRDERCVPVWSIGSPTQNSGWWSIRLQVTAFTWSVYLFCFLGYFTALLVRRIYSVWC
jgi:hypothetical protein